MIRLCTGADVRRLLERVIAKPERFVQVTVCTPFIDGVIADRLVHLAVNAKHVRCGVRIVTSAEGAVALRARLPGHGATWRSLIGIGDRLHAKVYICLARRRRESEAIVTSANLTVAGVEQNMELGVSAVPSSESGKCLLAEVRDFVQRLVAA